jgi:hypothetical protein
MLYNWIDSSIREVIEELPEIVRRFGYVLITSIDSQNDLRSLVNYHSNIFKDIHHEYLKEGVVLEGESILKLSESKIFFTGFDEIWCFYSKPQMYPNQCLVGPSNITECVSVEHETWMNAAGCILGMGDGTGLNYITTEESISHKLNSMRNL